MHSLVKAEAYPVDLTFPVEHLRRDRPSDVLY
jgi:hypothetical protein